MKGFSSKRIALKADMSQDRKIYCLQARPSIFRAGNFTGWGSEGLRFFMFLSAILKRLASKTKVVDPSADRVLVVKAKAGDSKASATVFD